MAPRVQTSPEVREGDRRRMYAADHPLLLWISSMAVIGGVTFLLAPSILGHSSLGAVLPAGLERVWALVYIIGGGGVLAGFYYLDARMEVAGLVFLAGCYSAYCYAIFVNRGFSSGLAAASVFIGLTAGCCNRAYVLRFEPERSPWRGRKRS